MYRTVPVILAVVIITAMIGVNVFSEQAFASSAASAAARGGCTAGRQAGRQISGNGQRQAIVRQQQQWWNQAAAAAAGDEFGSDGSIIR